MSFGSLSIPIEYMLSFHGFIPKQDNEAEILCIYVK